ncbi:MAG TPA: hypothetical protein VKA67_06435 [Verrucomicrobiae bacterium]|nr:hypothetical protein [Verrucomicrobiae bacterium]
MKTPQNNKDSKMRTSTARIWTGLIALMAAGITAQAQYTYTTLDDPLGMDTYANGISGTNIVGTYDDSSGDTHGFLYNGSTYTTLDDPLAAPFLFFGKRTYAQGISGTNIVGYYYGYSSSVENNGFLYNGNAWTTLDDPLGVNTYAYGISETNIVGEYDTNGVSHGFLYNGRTWVTLDDPLGAIGTHANGVSGTNIVGEYTDANGAYHGFLFNGRTWIALDDPLGAKGTQSEGTDAEGISGATIVGYYTDSNGVAHGFVATPTSSPTPSLAIAHLGRGLRISWPYPSTGWVLQQNTDLSTTNWTPAIGVTNDGTINFISNTSPAGNLYFRLRQQ